MLTINSIMYHSIIYVSNITHSPNKAPYTGVVYASVYVVICCQKQPLKDTSNYNKDIGLCSCNQSLVQEHKGYYNPLRSSIHSFHHIIQNMFMSWSAMMDLWLVTNSSGWTTCHSHYLSSTLSVIGYLVHNINTVVNSTINTNGMTYTTTFSVENKYWLRPHVTFTTFQLQIWNLKWQPSRIICAIHMDVIQRPKISPRLEVSTIYRATS